MEIRVEENPAAVVAEMLGEAASAGGQIVLTGSLVKTVWLNAGDRVKMELDGLGTVAVEFPS